MLQVIGNYYLWTISFPFKEEEFFLKKVILGELPDPDQVPQITWIKEHWSDIKTYAMLGFVMDLDQAKKDKEKQPEKPKTFPYSTVQSQDQVVERG